jgi:hypothetical protein
MEITGRAVIGALYPAGAYGIEAAMAVLLERPEVLHSVSRAALPLVLMRPPVFVQE